MTSITETDIPLAFWAGYREVVLVSSKFLASWTVLVSEDDGRYYRVWPRRWLDINGRLIREIWEAAKRAVVAVVLFHPGISQVRLSSHSSRSGADNYQG